MDKNLLQKDFIEIQDRIDNAECRYDLDGIKEFIDELIEKYCKQVSLDL
jgi:hypothetical protein